MAKRKLAPKDKRQSKWWQKRNTARKPKQEQHAKKLEEKKLADELLGP